jgi:serine/threonine protein kinase
MNVADFQRYGIGKILTETPFYNVHEGLDQHTGKKVIIKLFKSGSFSILLSPAEMGIEFDRIKNLLHPGIARVLNIYFGSNQLILFEEWIEGMPLDRYISSVTGAIPESRLLPIILRMVEAVAYAHAKYCTHLALQPQNILFLPTGEPKILNFGITAFFQPKHQHLYTLSNLAGLVYRSPEQLAINPEQPVDFQSDVYALGVILFCLLTGRTPIEPPTGISPEAFLRTLVTTTIPAASGLHPPTIISPAMDAIVLKATHPDRKQRFSSAAEMYTALQKLNAPTAHRSDKPQEKQTTDFKQSHFPPPQGNFVGYNPPHYPPPEYPPVDAYLDENAQLMYTIMPHRLPRNIHTASHPPRDAHHSPNNPIRCWLAAVTNALILLLLTHLIIIGNRMSIDWCVSFWVFSVVISRLFLRYFIIATEDKKAPGIKIIDPHTDKKKTCSKAESSQSGSVGCYGIARSIHSVSSPLTAKPLTTEPA